MRTSSIILLWVISVPTAMAAIFGILLPVLWKPIYDEPPPNSTIAISTFLAVFIALLSLGVAGFGAAIYRFLNDIITTRFESAVEDAGIRAEKPFASVYAQLALMRYGDYSRTSDNSHLDEAIELIEVAWYSYSTILDEDIQGDDEIRATLRNYWGFFLATRGETKDADKARECAAYLKPRLVQYHAYADEWTDTIALIAEKYGT